MEEEIYTQEETACNRGLELPEKIPIMINDLPVEILAEIFSYVRNFNERFRMFKVCPLWKAVVDETLGLRKWIGNGSEFWDMKLNKWKPLMEIRRRGVAHCFISNLTDEFENFSNPEDIGFIRPNLVEKLEFDGFISQEIYERLVKPLKNVTILAFHISTLTLLNVNLQGKIFVQTLSKLSLTYEAFSQHFFKIYGNDMELAYKNLQSILRIHFPKLTTFESSMPLFLDKELELFCPMAAFLNKHARTLDCLSLKWNHRWRVNDKNDLHRTNNEMDEINDGLDAQIQLVDESILSSTSLKTLVFIIEDRRIICPTSLGIKAVLLAQRNLTKLYYMCWDYIETPVDLLRNNSSSLKELGLTINDLNNPLDCTVFSQCVYLRKLVLEADGEVGFEDIAQAPKLQNAQHLPQSLTTISFRNIYMESQTVEILGKEMSNLRILSLINIGKINNLGMTISCLLWILQQSPTIKLLKVKGLNEKCFKASFGRCIDAYAKFVQGMVVVEDTACPVCDPKLHEGEGWGNESSHNKGLNNDTKVLLEKLLEETTMGTQYIPMIKKYDGIWYKSDSFIGE